MIKLYQFAPAWDLPNLSPFFLKDGAAWTISSPIAL